ncbi:MAG: insulinase family protein [Gemmatimonadetes bacterium]|nr:insulinase family protein [Gemmatimonadota bacterium]
MRLPRLILSGLLLPAALAPALLGQAVSRPAAAPPPAGAAITKSCPVLRAATAARARPRATRGPTVEGITEYTLPNGLRVLLFPDASKPTVTVNATYLVGSRHEAYGETGMAHLLEHLVFKGTPCHRNIPQELSEHGANPNGSTWFDRTNYFETFAATDANLAWALDLEADRMVNSYIAREDLQSEFTVVRNEFEMGENDPGSILEERVMSTAFLWHNYGNSTIGARADLENVPIERLQGFYRKYYQPDNAILVVAGKFDEAKTLRLIEEKFGRIPRPARTGDMKLWPTYTLDPTQDGEREVTLRRVGDVQVLTAVYHVPAGSHPDFAAVDVLARVLGSQPSGRLYQALVVPKKAANAFAFAYRLREPGALLATVQVRKEDPLGPAREALLGALDAAVTTPATPEEVERAKVEITKNTELLINNSERVALTLSEWASMADWRMLFIHRDRVKQVTPADVQRVAAAYLKPSNRTLGTFLPTEKPDRAEMPATPDWTPVVTAYRGDTAVTQGEAFDPSPATIDQRTARHRAGGLAVAFLPKRTRGGSVNASLSLDFNDMEGARGKRAIGSLTSQMLLRGTRSKSRQQIKDEFDRLKARVGVFGGYDAANARIETVRGNLPAVLRLLGEVLREPAFDAKEFGELKQQSLAQLEESRSDPQALAFTAFERYLSPYPKDDPRYRPTVEEQVAELSAVTIEDVRRFYAETYGAGHATLALVGDFDPAEITPVLTAIFGEWKSPRPWVRIPSAFHDQPATSIAIETPDKANAMFLGGINLNLRDDDPDYAALLLGNEVLGGGFLNSRLATRIRQKDGISYGVGSFLSVSSEDKASRFMGYAIYAPENAARVEAAFREELERVAREGITQDELDKARQGWLQNQQVGRSNDGQLSGDLQGKVYLGRTMAFDADLEHRVSGLTLQQVNGALQRYLDPAKLTVVKAGDFAKGRQPASP